MADAFDTASIWQQVLCDQHQAFELVVARYQSAVSAVAYSVTGDLTQSQDIAQETFLVAWSTRSELQQPERLGAWLCGIARNLSRQQMKQNRRSHAMAEDVDQLKDEQSNPLIQSISAEEQMLVQQALDAMPESYREAMVLFYRQEESIAEVADCLGLTQDAVRQRLSRGRALMRDRLMHLVKETLIQTRPSRAFTRSVMAAIGSLSMASQVAQAAAPASLTGAVSLTAAKAAAGSGISASVGSIGGFMGLVGAWVGQWFHVRIVESEAERTLAQAYGRKALLLVAMLVLSLLGLSVLLRLPSPYGRISYFVGLGLVLALYQWQLMKAYRAKERQVSMLRDLNQLGAENSTWLRRFMQLDSGSRYRWRGRVFRSRWEWFGLPILDIQIADPGVRADRPRRTAVGWIAVGDYAEGRLLAMGERAYGMIAIGGIAKGLLAFGGCAIGGVAIGGIAIGGICIGGLSVGVFGLGGLSVGGIAVGGIAVGVYRAFGSIAISCYDAIGNIAVSLHTASGWKSYAAIDAQGSERALEYQRLASAFRVYQIVFAIGVVVFSIVLSVFTLPLVYYLAPRESDAESSHLRSDDEGT